MAVTVDLVKKLILQYIGGTPVFGNPGKVNAAKKTIVVKKLGSLTGLLSGNLGSIVNQATSLAGAMSSLVQNPLGALTSQISSLTGNLTSQLSGITGLSSSLVNQVTGSIGQLQSATQGLLDHTNLISGVTQDLDNLPDGLMSAAQIFQVDDPASSLSMCSALFSGDTVDTVRQSLDPSLPGGVSDLMNSLSSATDSNIQSQLAGSVSQLLSNHATTLNSIVASDQSAQTKYLLKQDVVSTVSNLIPDGTNPAQNLIFGQIATDSLQSIASDIGGQ